MLQNFIAWNTAIVFYQEPHLRERKATFYLYITLVYPKLKVGAHQASASVSKFCPGITEAGMLYRYGFFTCATQLIGPKTP